METILLNVEGMSCGSCVKHVERAVSSIQGVEKVVVELKTGEVRVEGQSLPETNEIIQALKDDGYPAKLSSISGD